MQRRTNIEWLSELRGDRDLKKQEEAHEDLGKHVYEVTNNYLRYGQDKSNPYFIGGLTGLSLKKMAKDLVQDTLEKVAADNFALLGEFESLAQSEESVSFPHWVASIIVFEELRGDRGDERQSIALQSLIAYVYNATANFLMCNKSQTHWYVSSLQPEELKQLAQDFAQETYEKVVCDDFAWLKKFSGKGRFTSWLTTNVKNSVRNELRKRYWAKRAKHTSSLLTGPGQDEDEEGNQVEWHIESEEMSTENKAILQQVGIDFRKCLEQLPKSRKIAILMRLVEERSARETAQLMKKTEQAVHTLVARAKPKIRECLQKKGWDVDIFYIFDE